MLITKSEILGDNKQVDGRRRILEMHTDDSGKVYYYTYLAESNTNVEAVLQIHAAGLIPSPEEKSAEMSEELDKIQVELDFLNDADAVKARIDELVAKKAVLDAEADSLVLVSP